MDTDHVDLDGSDDLRELAWMYVNCIAYHICWILGLQFGGFSDAIVQREEPPDFIVDQLASDVHFFYHQDDGFT